MFRWRVKKLRGNEKGQSAIEFIAVVVVILFFLLFFLSLSILLVVSDYMEYATFMSARTYKSMFSTEGIQERNARVVFNTYAQRVQGMARNFELEFLKGDERGDQGAGVRVSYDVDLFYLPPIFMRSVPGGVLRLSTETRLGRDPSYEECFNYFERFVRKMGVNVDGRLMGLMDDNGC